MNALTKPADMPLTMTSREIADLTGKEHKHVMRDLRTLQDQLGTLFVGSVQDWTHPQNGQIYEEFVLDKETTLTLLLGYDAVARMKVVKRWQELESGAQAPTPTALTRMQILEIAMESEKARIEAEAQRDEAVRTKALIGSKREATAMATAAKAVREVARLTEELGRNAKQATVIAVEKALGRELGKQDWVPLRRYCKAKGLHAEKVHDPRWGEATAWPAEAWRAVHNIDLNSLFPHHPQMQ